MHYWRTITLLAVALTAILPWLAFPADRRPVSRTSTSVTARPEAVTGQVLHVDRKLGLLILITEEGVRFFEGPAAALAKVEVGDLVDLLAIREQAPASAARPSVSPAAADVDLGVPGLR
jgi:hypothetical protein